MEVINHTKRTFTAVALILAQSTLGYNQSGKEALELKVLLGQKSTLCNDTHPLAANEVLHISAHEGLALFIDQSFQAGDEVRLTLEIIQQYNKTTLQLEHIEHHATRHTATAR